MSFSFRPAARAGSIIMLGIAGPSRSGKTYSALRIATGLAQGGPIYFVDTESGRALQYADAFKFQHGALNEPFTAERYTEAIKTAAAAKAVVVIVDSASHLHEGPGGILEQQEAELQRMAGNDFAKRERVKFAAWIKPKAAHNRYVNTLLQINTHMIFCFRAKDKLVMAKDAQSKIVPVSAGWTAICTDRFEYEMGAMLVLPENSKGVPDYEAKSTSLRSPFDTILKPGEQLSEDTGRRLAAWAKGATAKAPVERPAAALKETPANPTAAPTPGNYDIQLETRVISCANAGEWAEKMMSILQVIKKKRGAESLYDLNRDRMDALRLEGHGDLVDPVQSAIDDWLLADA